MKKKVLITGSNGFIGSHMSKKCLQEGYHVVGVDMHSSAFFNQVEYYQLDLVRRSLDDLLRKIKPYAFIHCAGAADVNASIRNPDSDFMSNVLVTRNILYSLYECSGETVFLFLSSAGVYGNPEFNPIEESTARNPVSPYALHKVLAEELCNYFIRQHDMDIRILRIFSAYGIGLKKQIFWDMAQKVKSNHQLELFGTGCETRDFIYIDDLVQAVFLIMEAKKQTSFIYNVANGIEISIREAAEIFADQCGLNREMISFNQCTREGNPLNWCADIGQLNYLGYQPKVDIVSGIGKYVDWLRETGVLS